MVIPGRVRLNLIVLRSSKGVFEVILPEPLLEFGHTGTFALKSNATLGKIS